jgi:hypothetical protein
MLSSSYCIQLRLLLLLHIMLLLVLLLMSVRAITAVTPTTSLLSLLLAFVVNLHFTDEASTTSAACVNTAVFRQCQTTPCYPTTTPCYVRCNKTLLILFPQLIIPAAVSNKTLMILLRILLPQLSHTCEYAGVFENAGVFR